MIVKLCEHNVNSIPFAKRVSRELPGVVVHIVPCLRKCDPCREMIVAVCDGETIKARDLEGLLEKLRELLKG